MPLIWRGTKQKIRIKVVSIIIPTYNREELLEGTLQSIQQQQYSDWECLLVDDGSTDQTKQLAQRYVTMDSRFRWFERPASIKKGANGCRNFGFLKSSGHYVMWFDSDDVLHPDLLSIKVESMGDGTDVLFHRNRYANFNMDRFRDSRWEYEKDVPLLFHFAQDRIELHTSCGLWDRNFLAGKDLWDPDFSRYQDNDFHLRMLSHGPSIEITDQVLATIRGGSGHPSQISSKQAISTKKLKDIYLYRNRSLKQGKRLPIPLQKRYNPVVFNKTKWALYAYLVHERNFLKRIGIYTKEVFALLSFASYRRISLFETLRAVAYLKYLVVVGKLPTNKHSD